MANSTSLSFPNWPPGFGLANADQLCAPRVNFCTPLTPSLPVLEINIHIELNREKFLGPLVQVEGTEFRSAYSLDKLYPESRGADTAWRVPGDAKQGNDDIPVDGLTISYCRSSGPGSQNVNKVNSKAEVRFHLASADWIAEPVGQKMALTHKSKINRAGELILTSECSRYQFRNLADCLQKIRDMIAEASQPATEPSKEDAALQKLRKHES
ncbi:Peptidyl-tRNA hydrolase ICT1, mitochondrial [Bos mutus]|uniref:Large ribosomal subunit protein mL62 n=1 Tax=Bos mutus TaxID=72004 RepID=L8I224_9CETA|nr:Peptidyl-tRNA hydrolase ICT1, mitochondrial [Bos mutus]